MAPSVATARSDVFRADSPQFTRRALLKLVADNTPKNVAPIAQASTAEVTENLANALRSAVNGLDSGAKRIMLACGCNQRTAENLLAGNNAPSALYMLRLMANCPEFAAEVDRLTGRQARMDPKFESDFMQLIQTWAKQNEPAEQV